MFRCDFCNRACAFFGDQADSVHLIDQFFDVDLVVVVI